MLSPRSRPNILFLVPEDMGIQLGCYGDPYARTPNIDRLASEGVRFTQATVPYAMCSPSRACALTGLYPHQNGHLGLATHAFQLYESDTPNLVTHLQSGGYRTGIVGKLHVNPEKAFPFDSAAIPGPNFSREIPMSQYVASAREFWTQSADQPWFLSVNFPDAHLPFIRTADGLPANPQTAEEVKPPSFVGGETPDLLAETANYYNCVSRLDSGIGDLLAALKADGYADNTLIIFMCDHGPQFPRGKGTVYEGGIRVPLIMSGPGITAPGSVCHELVSNVNQLPTALHAAGLPIPENLPGRPLQPLLDGLPHDDWAGYQFSMTTGSFPQNSTIQESYRVGPWKLIWTPPQKESNRIAASYLDPNHFLTVVTGLYQDEVATFSPKSSAGYRHWKNPPEYALFNLEYDPDEWHDLAPDPQYADQLSRLMAAHRKFQRETRDPFIDPANREAYLSEQRDYDDCRYKSMPDFKWQHVDKFRLWRTSKLMN